MQSIITSENNFIQLDDWIKQNNIQKLMLVCDISLQFLNAINDKLAKLDTQIIRFDDFHPNPLYESVVKGVKLFRNEKCDAIMAIGGGSAIDVAKCIKLYSNMQGDGENGDFLKQTITANTIPFLAMPTTAGTGSEATRYAVIYYEDKKQSVSDYSCIPQTVLFDPSVLKTLPIYHKKATMMDAFCHAIESFWSVNSTDESKEYSRKAIKLILENKDGYINNNENANANMLKAANLAGKAINITQTTAGHAMCYKLTSLYGIAHGHAAALCVRSLFPYMIENTDKCIDQRGEEFLKMTFDEIANAMDCKTAQSAAEKFAQIVDSLKLDVPEINDGNDIDILKNSVNPDRLKNNPVKLDLQAIEKLYLEL